MSNPCRRFLRLSVLLLCTIAVSSAQADTSLCIRNRVRIKGPSVNLKRALPLATTGQCPKGTSEVGSGFLTNARLFGDGSSGILNVTEDTELATASTHLYSKVSIAVGATLTVQSGTVLKVSGEFINQGTVEVSPYAMGGKHLIFDLGLSSLEDGRANPGIAPGVAGRGDFGQSTAFLYGGNFTQGFGSALILHPGPLGGGGGAIGGQSREFGFLGSGGGTGGGTFTVLAANGITNTGTIN
ncbi:MAG: hypothetical protein KDD62_03210, partial [Bdellovibrionales bacterium]|nr:hypothetical protein [Bdellovibrionales bacterium]